MAAAIHESKSLFHVVCDVTACYRDERTDFDDLFKFLIVFLD